MSKGKIISFIILLLILLAIPFALNLNKQRFSRPRALAGKANFLLNSSIPENTSEIGHDFDVLVSLQLTDPNVRVTGVDFRLLYDKDKLLVKNIRPATHDVDASYPFTAAPVVVKDGGDYTAEAGFKYLRVALVADVSNMASAAASLATVTFTTTGAGSANIKFPEDNNMLQVVGYGPMPTIAQ